MADHIPITISPKHNLQVKRLVLSHLYVLTGDKCFKTLNCNSAYVRVYPYVYITSQMHMYARTLKSTYSAASVHELNPFLNSSHRVHPMILVGTESITIPSTTLLKLELWNEF